MAAKPPLPPRPATPAAPQAPKVSGAPRPKLGVRIKSFLKVFKPLLILPLLAIAAILVYYFVPEKVGRYNLNLYCLIFIGVLAGIVVLWVLVRLINYIVQWRRIRKQEELLGKQELLRIQESLAERYERVAALLKSASVGRYDMPWYFILGGEESGAQGLLKDFDMPSPEVAQAASLISDPNFIDRWVVTNEAVFIDTTGRGMTDFTRESEKAEWDAFLDLLVQKRPRCPINGAILTISAHELASDLPETRKVKAQQILSRLRYIQNLVKIRMPVYLVVTQMERILGFSEYFGGLDEAEKGQMLGWSNPNPPDARLSLHIFSQAFDSLSRDLKDQRIRRLGGNTSYDAPQRALLFPEEFACLEEPLGDYIRPLLEETRFAEPPVFRGFYFTGGKEPGFLTTLYCKKYLPVNVLAAMAPSPAAGTPSQALFVNDLFTKKIFLEPGLVTRPRSVFRKNFRIRTLGALFLSLFILVGTLYLISFAKNWAKEIQVLEADIQQARDVLLLKKQGTNTLPLCIRLATHKEQMKHKGFLARILGLGRYDLLAKEIGLIHRGLFQETTLKDLLNKVESGLDQWRGIRSRGDPNFHLFSAALTEYTEWSNPTFRLSHTLDIRVFLDFLQFPQRPKYQYLDQFRVYVQEGGRGRRMVGSGSEDIIRRALVTARVYLRPTLLNTYTPAAQLSDAQWWLSLATRLRNIYDSHHHLLRARVPVDETPREEMSAQYNEFRGFLYGMLDETQNLLEHIRGGRESIVLWIDAGAFYDKLLSVSRGMAGLETVVERDRLNVVADYNERVVAEIVRLVPLLNLMGGYPSYGWLFDVLVRAFGPDFTAKISDLGAGNMIQDLLAKVEIYDRLIQDLETSFAPWMEKLPVEIATLDDSRNPLKTAQLNLQRAAVRHSRQALDEFATKPIQPGPHAAAQTAGALPAETEEDKQKEEKRKAVVSFWEAITLASRTIQWLEVQDRVRMHAESRYLEEILTRADFTQGILNTGSWYEIKNMEIFRKGDGVAMVTPIHEFLDRWVRFIPQPIRILTKEEEGVKHYPEMRGFEKRLGEVLLLQETYMENLRMGANNFAKCIQAMDMDVGLAWQTLRDAPPPNQDTGQLISWKNLQSLTGFRESLEMEKGPINRFMTGQLEQIETHVLGIYRTELVRMHRNRRAQLFEKYDKLRIADKFPFRIDGPQMGAARMLTFFDDLSAMKGHFKIEEGPYRIDPEGKRVPLYSMARSIAIELGNDQWRRFYKTYSALKSFLFEKRTPRTHKFAASLVPGPVGSHFHWVRINFGNGTFKDINVYGEPTVEMSLESGDRSVTIQGLDAARTPQVTKAVNEGDHALLQMIYLYGKPTDEQRTTWLVDVELPTNDNPSFNVISTFKFVFKEGLPVLPDWKNFQLFPSTVTR